MTPEEKSEELIGKYFHVLSTYSMSKVHRREYGVKISIIHCQEVLNLDPKIGLKQEDFYRKVLTILKNKVQ